MNRVRRGYIFGGFGLLIGIAIVIVLLATRAQPTNASSPFAPHPLTGMSADEISRYALSWTNANDQIISNVAPTVILSRPLRDGDLTNFGDLAPVQAGEYVVVLEGDFLVAPGATGPTIAINAQPTPAKYLLEVFDQSGALESFGKDPTGAYVKPAVGDPTLPDLPQSERPPSGTSTSPPDDLPAPLSTPSSSGIGPGWTTPPTPMTAPAP